MGWLIIFPYFLWELFPHRKHCTFHPTTESRFEAFRKLQIFAIGESCRQNG